MIKVYQKYLFKKFLKKILLISLIFFSLIVILNIFEEISYFKDIKINFYFPLFLTLINSPSVLFQIFPFIFLISSLLLFLDLINKNELEFFKINGLNNLKIIKVLFFTSFFTGLFLIVFYYNFSSKLKFLYLDLKNNYSKDDKYLAMVTENGIWIKDEFNENIIIINAKKIKKEFLKDVLISEFNKNFNLVRIIKSPSVNIASKEWTISSSIIYEKNKPLIKNKTIKLNTHFNQKKINEMFSDLSSQNILELTRLADDYEKLGYSTLEIRSHLNKIFSLPIYLSIMTVFSSIIMLNIKKNKPMIFYLILSIFLSVVIYYFNYLFNLLGENGKLPIQISTWAPLFLLSVFILIGLVRIDEK
jgi:lipopolysaccharide export system permease protein|tara:strand:+ start:22 stop:1101 length:1080 start_codon:yes stop_codon:yes gene_type:complete